MTYDITLIAGHKTIYHRVKGADADEARRKVFAAYPGVRFIVTKCKPLSWKWETRSSGRPLTCVLKEAD